MTQMHKVTSNERQLEAEQNVERLIMALADHMGMSIPSAVYMTQQITCRHLASWSKPATIKTLRSTARYMSGDLKYGDFFKAQGKLFDEITAEYERQNGLGGPDQ